jgi:hypothetical protein
MKPEKCPCCDGWGKRHVYHDGSTVGEIVSCPNTEFVVRDLADLAAKLAEAERRARIAERALAMHEEEVDVLFMRDDGDEICGWYKGEEDGRYSPCIAQSIGREWDALRYAIAEAEEVPDEA